MEESTCNCLPYLTESLFPGGGYNTPPTSVPFLSNSPLELVSKNFPTGTVTFSQANSIFVQSQTDFLNGTSSLSTKKTCYGHWEHGLEPLHIQVPPINTIANLTIKSENISSGSTRSHSDYSSTSLTSATNLKDISNITTTNHLNHNHSNNSRDTEINSGCSRTIPISWSSSASATSTNIVENRNIGCPILHIKREPCQVSEISTSNNIGHTLTAVVKIETPSPKRTMDNVQNSAAQSGGAIPVGIAVARQRLQEHVQHQQPKDFNRFGIGLTDLGGATSAFSQNMFFTGTNSPMIPSFSSEAVTMGVSNVQNALRNPPNLWQYPTPVPVESMLQMPIPPVGFQLVRDPSTGQLLFLPTAPSIDKLYISYPEPFQQTVVWPSYPQPPMQTPHLLMPSITQQMQPPPLTPLQLLGSDYLGGTTLHQHTQTHSTRLVALTSEAKRKSSVPSIPMPMQPTTLIKIEDCGGGGGGGGETPNLNAISAHHHHHHHHQPSLYEPCKSTAIQTASITTAVQTNDISPDISTHQLYYQSEGNLIQITPHHAPHSTEIMESLIESRSNNVISPPPLRDSRCLASPIITSVEHTLTEQLDSTSMIVPEVQDANIQTDTPVMSEDDNTTGAEDASFPSSASDVIIHSIDECNIAVPSSTSFQDLCHNISSVSDSSFISQLDTNSSLNNTSKTDDTSFESSTAVTSSSMIDEFAVQTSIGVQYEVVEVAATAELEIQQQQPDSFGGAIQTKELSPDISGLELLSNSIEAFEKKTCIKKEPVDKHEMKFLKSPKLPQNDNDNEEFATAAEVLAPTDIASDCLAPSNEFAQTDEPLGGLNLLCALAEQRFQEEVGQRSRKRSSSSEGSDYKKMKKHHKDKDRSKKGGKKSKHNRDRKEKKPHHKHTSASDDDEGTIIDTNLKETFNRVKAMYPNCSCQTSATDTGKCCREKCQWPTPEEVYIAMKSDMRHRLAKIAKEFQEEKRKLDEIKNIEKYSNSDRELTPLSSKSSSEYDPDAGKSESIIPSDSSQSADGPPKNPSEFDDQDSNSSSSFKRKTELCDLSNHDEKPDAVINKKTKSLVGYIFANKKRLNDLKNENSSSALDETSMASSDVSASIIGPFKQEKCDDGTDIFGNGNLDKKHHKSKHSSKHKKSKIKEKRRHRSSEAKERKKRIDSKCILTEEFLDTFVAGDRKPRVLTAMGGLFYAGCLSAIEPPDVYAVTLDGERGNRPHILSREEILRDAILEVAPHSVDEVPPGTRLCAYWSQQYRCLYPGTSAQLNSPDYEADSKFIIVEFDDGDSGRIAIEDIRFLLSDYPIVEYDPNPLLTLGKRKQRNSQSMTEGTSAADHPTAETLSTINSLNIQNSDIKDEEKRANKERKRLKKIRKEKSKQMDKCLDTDKKHKHKHKCSDDLCKHRKHKKRRKHKKYRHGSQSPETVKQEEEEEEEEEDEEEEAGDQITTKERIENETQNNGNEEEGTSTNNERNKPPKVINVLPINVKEETMTEDDEASTMTESSGSLYKPGKKKDKQNAAENNSKIAAFLPARQLWAWAGKGFKRSGVKGRGKKQFFKTIQRGKESITIGDSAVFLSTGRPDRPYIGRIESLWETSSSNRVVRVKWYYHPEETIGCPKLLYPGALFQSPHADENDVQTISHKCKVLPLGSYTQIYGPDPKQYGSVYDNNDCFYLAGYYDPTSIALKLESHIPTVPEN